MSTLCMIPPDITKPSTDNYTVIVDKSTSSVELMCSLNVIIPSSVTVVWLLNGSDVTTMSPNNVTQTGNTTTLLLGELQLSDAGVYQCVFSDNGNGWILRININLLITGLLFTVKLWPCSSYCIAT